MRVGVRNVKFGPLKVGFGAVVDDFVFTSRRDMRVPRGYINK